VWSGESGGIDDQVRLNLPQAARAMAGDGEAVAAGVQLADAEAGDQLDAALIEQGAQVGDELAEHLASASWRLLGARAARARAIARAREQAAEEAEMFLGRLRGATSSSSARRPASSGPACSATRPPWRPA
jgi:hypothetical protein